MNLTRASERRSSTYGLCDLTLEVQYEVTTGLISRILDGVIAGVRERRITD